MSSQPTAEQVREFVIAGHGNFDKVKAMLADCPALLNIAHPWAENDHETALLGAAHVGNVTIAEYLLAQGAPSDICTAAMLGRKAEVESFVQADTAAIATNGAHGIPLLTHAALSGNLELVQWLFAQGARTGVSPAFHNAVNRRYSPLVHWLLEAAEPDLTWKNFQGKTALAVALENNDEATVHLLRTYGATE